MKADYDQLVDGFGPHFPKPYGWAADALGNPIPKFVDLEKAAEIAHYRSYYKWACHESHADATGARMNIYQVGPAYFKASGRVDAGLADPGHLTAVYLHQITAAVTLSADAGPRTLIELTVLQGLVESLGDLLRDAEAKQPKPSTPR